MTEPNTFQFQGKYVEFDGPDGAGKGTQISLLKEKLTELGVKSYTTLQPGGTDLGREMRKILLHGVYEKELSPHVLLLGFMVDRTHQVHYVTQKTMEGFCVIGDRGPGSTYAYQIYAAHDGRPDPKLVQVFKDMHSFFLQEQYPSISIWLDVDVEVSRSRNLVSSKPSDRFETRSSDFHTLVKAGYAEYFEQVLPDLFPKTRVMKINSHQEPKQISKQIFERLSQV